MLTKLLLIGFLAGMSLVSLTLIGSSRAAFDVGISGCTASFEVNFNGGNHPPLYLDLEDLQVNVVSELDGTKRFEVSGDDPFINVVGVFTETVPGIGTISAGGDGNYAGFDTTVTFEGVLAFFLDDEFGPGFIVLDELSGKFSVGPDGTLPGGQPIDYALQCDFEPDPIPTPTQGPPVSKVSLITSTMEGVGLPGFEMNLFGGAGCVPENLVVSGLTDAEGVFSTDQPDGTYSASRKGRAGWNGGAGACFEEFDHFAPGTNINFSVEEDEAPPIPPPTPPQETGRIGVTKVDDETRESLSGWEINFFEGDGCQGPPIASGVTTGIVVMESPPLAPGPHSVSEKPQPGWTNITPLCQDIIVEANSLRLMSFVNAPLHNGDVNGDGVTNSLDAQLILQFVALLLPALPNERQGDVNFDGVIDSVDAVLILQFDARLLESLPVGGP